MKAGTTLSVRPQVEDVVAQAGTLLWRTRGASEKEEADQLCVNKAYAKTFMFSQTKDLGRTSAAEKDGQNMFCVP